MSLIQIYKIRLILDISVRIQNRMGGYLMSYKEDITKLLDIQELIVVDFETKEFVLISNWK